ncbi:FixH family protein [Ornithinibacillus sp. 179-J 7C1 HS]|uniref:FixH family protein n=1 Tax=Ornithinibacillus sp. 179-J 7C1 HS TaxID=3142384 RepID=UPI0039A32F89
MKKYIGILMFALIVVALAACGKDEGNTEVEEEVGVLEVDFQLPETAEAGEKVELTAIVTYGDNKVTDADEMEFEYWMQGNEDETTTVEATNNADGTYTAEISFDTDGVYEIYAHTTARDMHTMPKKSITIGEGHAAHHEEEHHDDEGSHEHGHSHSHTEGFAMHFIELEDVQVNEEVELGLHLEMNNEPLEGARVRYQINKDGTEEYAWVDTEESAPGEYSNSHSFNTAGTYTIVIHVENDEGLHEHEEHTIEVK